MASIGQMGNLREEFIELIEKDKEFRYVVAGYLGLSEILKRLDRLEEAHNKLWENQNRLWEEVKALRGGQEKLWENQNKLWEEVKALREGQNKLWENQNKLWENQNKLWEEVKSLREGQNKLWENQNRLWEEVKALRINYGRLDRTVESLRDSMVHGFGELSRFAGLTFEEFTRRFLSQYLRSMNVIPKDAELKKAVIDGEEINMFFENPLIVGEVTSHAESLGEVDKLMRKAEAARSKYKREPLKYLVVLTAGREIAKEIRKKAEENMIELIIGKEIEG
jgi:chromosome segregation ATPase